MLLQTLPRRHRIKAPRLALPLWPVAGLAEDEERRCSGSETRRGGLNLENQGNGAIKFRWRQSSAGCGSGPSWSNTWPRLRQSTHSPHTGHRYKYSASSLGGSYFPRGNSMIVLCCSAILVPPMRGAGIRFRLAWKGKPRRSGAFPDSIAEEIPPSSARIQFGARRLVPCSKCHSHRISESCCCGESGRPLGRKQQWDKWARGCSELEFVQIAKVQLELGKGYCDRYSQ
jgi:hypothetical protein